MPGSDFSVVTSRNPVLGGDVNDHDHAIDGSTPGATGIPIRPARAGLRRPFEEPEQVGDRAVLVLGMAERKLAVDLVPVAAPLARLCDVAGSYEIIDDLGSGAFRHADDEGDVSQTDGGVARDRFENTRVIGHEPPAGVALSRGRIDPHVPTILRPGD
jgi:hypothetical protein